MEASIVAFRRDGYESATLERIGDVLGLTRSAVLYHFSSKADILTELVRPLMDSIDGLLDRVEQHPAPLRARGQRQFLGELVDAFAEHRDATAIMTRDIASHRYLGAGLQVSDRLNRFAALMIADHEGDELAAVRAMAALGAIIRPLGLPDEMLDFSSPLHRQALLECAVAALRSKRR